MRPCQQCYFPAAIEVVLQLEERQISYLEEGQAKLTMNCI
jgi:hypothetical protein